jgi:hypothetical protein
MLASFSSVAWTAPSASFITSPQDTYWIVSHLTTSSSAARAAIVARPATGSDDRPILSERVGNPFWIMLV